MTEKSNVILNVAKAYSEGGIPAGVAVIEEFKKAQIIRILDSVFIGPVMMYYAYKGRLNKTERTILFALGLSTVIYNYSNWQKTKQSSHDFMKTVANDPLTPKLLSPVLAEEIEG